MGKNIIEKIWEKHVVSSERGCPDIFLIDFHLMHEVTTPQAFQVLRKRKIALHNTKKCIATIDHTISTDNPYRAGADRMAQMGELRKNIENFGIKLFDVGSGYQGIVHVIGPELGLTQPGMTIACGDSHTSTHGAFGAIAFGIGTTEISHIMATGCLLQSKPKTMKVAFEGGVGKGVGAKDMILRLIGEIGVDGGKGHIIEYSGSALSELSMEERMTICNMSIECGARAGVIAPDQKTFDYIKGRKYAPKGRRFEKAVEYWKTLKSDVDSGYDKEVSINVSDIQPMVTWGINPSQVISIDECIPFPDEVGALKQTFDYVGLSPGQSILGVPIDYVFIGSCTNGRLSDLKQAADILKGREVAENVKALIVPGSEWVYGEAERVGLAEIFRRAGAEFRRPGCSMCIAMNGDIVPQGKRCASTSNRNFIGRQGKGSITHLMSPAMAAAAAVSGCIADVRKFL